MIYGGFYYDLADALVSTRFKIGTAFDIRFTTMARVLLEYIEEKRVDANYTYDKFIKFVLERNLSDVFVNHPESIYDLYVIFEGIFSSLGEYVWDTYVESKIAKLIYILIHNGLEYVQVDIDEIGYGGFEEKFIESIYNRELVDLIFEGNILKERDKKYFKRRFGFDEYEPHTLDELGKLSGVSLERVHNRLGRAFKNVRKSEKVINFRRLG